jgi:hypothetical protein
MKTDIEFKTLKEEIILSDKEKKRQYVLKINEAQDKEKNYPVFVRFERETIGNKNPNRLFLKVLMNFSLSELTLIEKSIKVIKEFKPKNHKEKTEEKDNDSDDLKNMIKSLVESNKELQKQINSIKKK